MTDTRVFTGACACARISFTCNVPPANGSTICHCITCRKLSGGAYHVYTSVPTDSVTWHDENEKKTYQGLPTEQTGIKLLHLSNIADRGACASCGAWLTMRYGYDMNKTYLTVSSIDLDSATEQNRARLQVNEEIFCGQRALWLGNDDRKIYDRLPPGMEAEVSERKESSPP